MGFVGDQGNGSTAMIKGVPATSSRFPLTLPVTDVLERSALHTITAGLQLDSKTGYISGRPAQRGRYVFYLAAKDELGASRSLKISIVIRP